MVCPCKALENALLESARRGKRITELEECLLTAEERLKQMTRERDEARAALATCPDCAMWAERSSRWHDDMQRAERERDDAREQLYLTKAELGRWVDRETKAVRERDEARAEAASSLAMARIADQKHDQKCAEVDMLRGVGCMEDGDGPCGVCRKCAYRRGAEAMREACAMLVLTSNAVHGRVDADALRALPISEEP